MKKTYLETLKDNIDNNYFQNEIIKDFDYKKINKKINIGKITGFSLLGFFVLVGIVLLCLINVVKIKNGQIIFPLSGAISILIGICVVFITPICNYKIIHNKFKKTYDFEKQNKYLKLALSNLENTEIKNIYINSDENLTINIEYKEKEYQIIYFEQYYEIYDLSKNELIKTNKAIHNLNQLIKIYYSDLDKTTFTSLNSFTFCMEIKLKKFAKLIVTDFAGIIGETNGNY